MERSEAVARIQQGLGFRTDLEDECAAALREAQRFYEKGKTLPWFLRTTTTLSVLEATRAVEIPERFIRETERPVIYTDDEGIEIRIKKRDYMHAWEAYRLEEAGAPEVYVLTRGELHFFPLPDADYTVTFPFYQAAEVLDSNIENTWLEEIPELLIGEAGYRLAADLQDAAGVKLFDSMRKQAWDSIFRETLAREEAQLDLSFGSDL